MAPVLMSCHRQSTDRWQEGSAPCHARKGAVGARLCYKAVSSDSAPADNDAAGAYEPHACTVPVPDLNHSPSPL